MAVLATAYKDEIVPKMMEKFNYDSVMAVPKIDKIVLNVGLGEAKDNQKLLDSVVEEIYIEITGQKPVVTRAKKSVSNFRLREGMPCRCKGNPERRTDVGVSLQIN